MSGKLDNNNENLDPKQAVEVKLHFVGLRTPLQIDQDPCQGKNLRTLFTEAKVIANNERVLLDKLGKTRGFVEFISKTAGVLAEVCITTASMAHIGLTFIQASSHRQGCIHCRGEPLHRKSPCSYVLDNHNLTSHRYASLKNNVETQSSI